MSERFSVGKAAFDIVHALLRASGRWHDRRARARPVSPRQGLPNAIFRLEIRARRTSLDVVEFAEFVKAMDFDPSAVMERPAGALVPLLPTPSAYHAARLLRSRPLRAAFGGCRKRQALIAPLCVIVRGYRDEGRFLFAPPSGGIEQRACREAPAAARGALFGGRHGLVPQPPCPAPRAKNRA